MQYALGLMIFYFFRLKGFVFVIHFDTAHKNVWDMSRGSLQSEPLSTKAETTTEVLPLATHKPRHY
jgi:hypothetical protein